MTTRVRIRPVPMVNRAVSCRCSFLIMAASILKAVANPCLLYTSMAKPAATREEIVHALKAAQCLDIIEKLPDGIDTVVGTNGV